MRKRSLQAAIAWLCLAAPLGAFAGETTAPIAPLVLEERSFVGGSENVILGKVADAAVAGNGTLYVLDSGFVTIHAFSSQGVYLGQFGREGEAPGEFYTPMAIATTPDGGLVVAGRSSVVTVFDREWMPSSSLSREFVNDVRSMVVSNAGDLYISSFNKFTQKVIHQFDLAAGAYVRSFGESYGVKLDLDVRQENIEAGGLLACSGEGLWYLQINPFWLQLYSWEGEQIREILGRNSESLETREPEYDGEAATFFLPRSWATGLVALNDSTLVTAFCIGIGESPRTMIDVYDSRDGSLMATKQVVGPARILDRDEEGNLLLGELRDEEPVVVRMSLSY